MKVYKIIIPLTAVSLLATFIAFVFLPDEIAILWTGNKSIFSVFKGITFLSALLPFAAYLLRTLVTKEGPDNDLYDMHQKPFEILILTVALIVAALHWSIIFHALGHKVGLFFFIKLLVGIFLVILGQIRQNIVFGAKKKSTHNKDMFMKMGRKTSGYMLIGAGLIFTLSAFFSEYFGTLMIVSILVIVIILNMIYLVSETRSL